MRRNVLSILLLLIATCSWAQGQNAQASDEKQRIPMDPIVIDGELTDVPDGTPVNFGYRTNKSSIYLYGDGLLHDTVRNGRFHIEKKFIYKDRLDSEDNIQYMLSSSGRYIDIYAYPGAKIKVTGKGTDAFYWHAESNHPFQEEYNKLKHGLFEKLAPVNKKLQEAHKADNIDAESIKKLKREKDIISANHRLDFLKDKEYNEFFISELRNASICAYTSKDSLLKLRIRNLMNEKFPIDHDRNDEYIADIKRHTASASNQLKYGDKMPDFTLYDRDDKEHKFSEFVGKKSILLQFSSAGCGPCQAIKPMIEELYAKHKNEVEIITISCDSEETWKKEKKVSWHDWNDHAFGSTVGSKFDIPGLPFYVIIRPDGTIGSTFPGNKGLLDYFKTF